MMLQTLRTAWGRRRSYRLLLSLPALLLTVVGFGQAQGTSTPAADSRAFTLTPHFEKGQVSRYKTLNSMNLAFTTPEGKGASIGQSMGIEITLRYRVQEIRPDGTVVLSVLSDGGKLVNPPDEPTTLPKETDKAQRTALLDKQGHILSLKSPGSASNTGPLGGLFDQMVNLFIQLHFLPLPEKPVKVGESWTARSPLPNARPLPKSASETDKAAGDTANAPTFIQSRLTLLGTEKVGDQETLQIKQEMTVPFEALADAQGKATTDPKKSASRVSAQITFTQTVNALPTDGQVLRTQGEIGGWIKLEGEVVKQAPSDTLKITGNLAAARQADEAGANGK
jgi:hypothetical protein